MTTQTVTHMGEAGKSYHAKPSPLVVSPWADDAVDFSLKSGTTTIHEASLDDSHGWLVYEGTKAAPIDAPDVPVATWDPGVTAITEDDGSGGRRIKASAATEIPTADAEAVGAAVAANLTSGQLLVTDLAKFVSNSTINVVQSSDYNAADGTAYEKEITLAGYDFTDVQTVEFGAGKDPQDPTVLGTATLTNKAVGSATLRLEFTKAQLNAAPDSLKWTVHATNTAGHRQPIDGGIFNLHASYNEAPA
ncbi:hypothetical protein [Crateriforma conspicua]|uniref:Uncharacterized protein n=1 Tax=Crateriforma conspicua TaxID=2527996 RepID=A0A5C6FTT6_9PLAN|nr:hypothetical protein [Crateriforma conspicua]TWU66452.1 hypothetical protein V7x_20180 [Crateriforma conspicua]